MNAWSVPGYTESRELGSGGSGRVVLAVHDATGVPVAVKYLSERLHTDSAFVRSFRAEARLLSGLGTPYVVGLYEYVEAPRGAAIVMELVNGIALSALLRQEGPTGPEAALVVLKGSLLGLAAAHRAGVVHRDYKPENVLVATDGSSKLVDFGIATGRGSTPGVAGTPAYMAPEQWNGEPASPAADVYAATATFYECLTGRKPFSGENFAELALQHIGAPVPEEEAPEPVRPLIRRGLAKEPRERPHNADAFVAELEELAGTAYGPDWEERGQRKLAALAALLPLLLPYAGGGPAGTTALATTALGGGRRGAGGRRGGRRGRSWKPGVRGMLATAVALVIAVVAAVTAGAVGDSPERTTAQAVTTAGPVQNPGAGPDATASVGPSGSMSPSPTGSASSGGSPTSPSVTDSATAGTAGTSTPPVAPPPPPASPSSSTPSVTPTSSAPTTDPVRVKSVSVTGLRQTGTTTATAAVGVATDGTGPVTVAITWSAGETYGELGAQDGSQTFRREGATQYTIQLDHTFQRQGCYWGVQATTDPAAASGGSSQQILIRRCVIS
ncbi:MULTISPECIES: serine/threonine-protein kinase [unclassified Streptomyces]|uniref:serine/threonine-protein kinase n=1 Tax=unclassified Streptomyces TaxID=2593676 RepID=UPI00081F698A|nr:MULTISPECIES: serine/threonine-protein kinase [unclassified Streptomyces]MYZ37418.1 protein kinase [Streptomyces sp. SID4917]SCF91139.1 serine/threonine protein kinase [Streptomyces sp. MnatMP-M17]